MQLEIAFFALLKIVSSSFKREAADDKMALLKTIAKHFKLISLFIGCAIGAKDGSSSKKWIFAPQ